MKFKTISVIVALVMIFTGIALMIVGLLTGVAKNGIQMFNKESFQMEFQDSNINAVSVDFNYGELKILPGDELKVDAKDVRKDSITCAVENNTLYIKAKKKFSGFEFFGWHNAPVLTVYVPKNISLEELYVNSGVGTFTMSDMSAKKVVLEGGVGEVDIDKLNAESIIIQSGVGSFNIKNSDLKNISLNSGVGEVIIDGKITGNCDINGGVGEINISSSGDIDDYSISTDHGVGSVSINGRSDREYINPSAENRITVENGVGEINIDIGG